MRRIALLVVAVLTGCVTGVDEPGVNPDHDEPADYELGAGGGKADEADPVFARNDVVSDALFLDTASLTVDEVQAFLEQTPYGSTSWLASYAQGGTPASALIHEAALRHDVNPMMLLARMQVEATLVSKEARPTQYRIDKALGCGCPDNAPCNTAFSGFAAQLECGAATMRRWFDASIEGDGIFTRGVSKRTLDPLTVTPANHATASLYAYTPWVLVGRGGNWLVWNVTRKYVNHARARGWID